MESPLPNDGRVTAIGNYVLPIWHLETLHVANGFVLRDGLFRLFGIRPAAKALDLEEWNRSPWVAEYGGASELLVFIAEDIFGDQYAVRYQSSADRDPTLVKFWCEGGAVEPINVESFSSWLSSAVLTQEPSILDMNLVTAAFEMNLHPSDKEHLGFSLPLIAGGECDESNLEVIERGFHLHLLGQISRKNRALPDGVRIDRFVQRH